jgi:hypothetical protein
MSNVLEQALEALEKYVSAYNDYWERGMDILEPVGENAIAALKEAIAQQSEPVAVYRYEPATLTYGVEWLIKDALPDRTELFTSAPTIPEGWQLVPKEPTFEMFVAGDPYMEGLSSLGEAWEAMLSASPTFKDERR